MARIKILGRDLEVFVASVVIPRPHKIVTCVIQGTSKIAKEPESRPQPRRVVGAREFDAGFDDASSEAKLVPRGGHS